jgi:hypothetical protein
MGCSQVDYHASELQLLPRLQHAVGESSPDPASGDCYGEMVYTDWYANGVPHSRRMVLAADEGVLVVWDTMAPNEALGAQRGGPIWHFGPEIDPVVTTTMGRLAVQSSGADVNLLVRYDFALYGTDGGRLRGTDLRYGSDAKRDNGTSGRGEARKRSQTCQVGFQTAGVWPHREQRTAFCVVDMLPRAQHSFVSVLVPIPNATTGAFGSLEPRLQALAVQPDVQIEQGERGAVSVRVNRPKGGTLVVDMNGSTWRVSRIS